MALRQVLGSRSASSNPPAPRQPRAVTSAPTESKDLLPPTFAESVDAITVTESNVKSIEARVYFIKAPTYASLFPPTYSEAVKLPDVAGIPGDSAAPSYEEATTSHRR